MKHFIFIAKLSLLYLLIGGNVYAQQILPRNNPGCSTGDSTKIAYLPDAENFLAQQLAARLGDTITNDFSAPYNVRVFIRIVRQDDGTLPGCTKEEALQNFEEMKGQFTPHNICFQLAGLDFVDDTYLNNFNNSSYLDAIYPDYIKNNNLDVDGAITIFVHYNFLNNSGSSGNAYGIPNNFLSVARWAATAASVRSIFGHEMGHCLGLYHTFQKMDGVQENVTRNVLNTCYNATSEGDLCADTPADFGTSDDFTNGTTCNYTGTATNSCDGLAYNPSTVNIMSYMPWTCISITGTALTSSQRTRMHSAINDPLGPLFTRVSENEVSLSGVVWSSNTIKLYGAKNNISHSNNTILSNTGSAKVYYVAGNSITFRTGATLAPGTTGLTNASISNCN